MRALAFAFLFTCTLCLQAAEPQRRSVKVVILAGQSNMQGHGRVKLDPKRNQGKGTLEHLVKSPKTAKRYAHLVTKNGAWVERDDVSIWYFERKGKLSVDYGAGKDLIGPELQFGHGLGLALPERPIISRAVSLDNPMEIQTGMVFALETYCPAADGFSAARIEEEVVVTDTGCEVISLFPAQDLPIANRY